MVMSWKNLYSFVVHFASNIIFSMFKKTVALSLKEKKAKSTQIKPLKKFHESENIKENYV